MATLEDFIAKDRKGMPFEERSAKFEEAIEPLMKEWGVAPGAVLQTTEVALVALPAMRNLWESGKE